MIGSVDQMSSDLRVGVRSLLPQLTSPDRLLSESELSRIVSSPHTKLFVARAGGNIIGMISLAVVQMPSGVRSYLEDLVVDSAYRRRGVATALLEAAIDHARRSGARSLDMTSRPSRRDAIRLYEKMGFRRRETNAFRYTFYK
jgi:ribosomal protein S18 acetylase RimI-like enzyme